MLVLGLLVGAGALFAWRRQEDRVPAATAAGPVGLAVLPFDTEGDTANAYFADGITNEIRGKLSALPALQVIAPEPAPTSIGTRPNHPRRSGVSWACSTC